MSVTEKKNLQVNKNISNLYKTTIFATVKQTYYISEVQVLVHTISYAR